VTQSWSPQPGPRPGPPPGGPPVAPAVPHHGGATGGAPVSHHGGGTVSHHSGEDTGHPAVDAVLRSLANAARLAPAEQIAEYEAAHQVLQETLASIDR
jgi:ribulose 1,5-bisphosphate carboxylase large subunit-like protein